MKSSSILGRSFIHLKQSAGSGPDITEKVMYFSVFSPKHSNSPSNSSASSFIIK